MLPRLPDDLVAVLAALDEEGLRLLLSDLLTPAEKKALSERWAIVKGLAGGRSQREVRDSVGVSISTVSPTPHSASRLVTPPRPVGWSVAARRLMSVVLPALFGPITASRTGRRQAATAPWSRSRTSSGRALARSRRRSASGGASGTSGHNWSAMPLDKSHIRTRGIAHSPRHGQTDGPGQAPFGGCRRWHAYCIQLDGGVDVQRSHSTIRHR